MLILGIDPGVQNIGIALLDTNTMTIRYHEKYTLDHSSQYYPNFITYLSQLLDDYKIDAISIEKPFFTPMTLAKNIRTLEVIGLIKYIGQRNQIPYYEYSPATIKKQFCDSGKTSKEAIMKKVKSLFNLDPKNTHTADACAIAFTHYVFCQ